MGFQETSIRVLPHGRNDRRPEESLSRRHIWYLHYKGAFKGRVRGADLFCYSLRHEWVPTDPWELERPGRPRMQEAGHHHPESIRVLWRGMVLLSRATVHTLFSSCGNSGTGLPKSQPQTLLDLADQLVANMGVCKEGFMGIKNFPLHQREQRLAELLVNQMWRCWRGE